MLDHSSSFLEGASCHMNAGRLQTLKDLIEFLKRQEIGEFDLQQEDLKVHLSFIGYHPGVQPVPSGSAGHPAVQPAGVSTPRAVAGDLATVESGIVPVEDQAGLHIVKSPIVGTFYEAPAPGADPFVKVGDQVEAGQVICIVEAMKLMNEIECDVSGEIVKRMAASGQPVEYGQPLFAIQPR
jgi:acetyl-CoA carboxylase biotin carboxyl carrier protein